MGRAWSRCVPHRATLKSKHRRRAQQARHGGRDATPASNAGTDPSADLQDLFFKPSGRQSRDRNRVDTKTRQLCRQVQQRLEIALGELQDPLLQGLWVESVEPEGGGRTLLVHVVVDDGAALLEVLDRLKAAQGHLRNEIAAAIHRKRTPLLVFMATPATALAGQEGEHIE